MELIAIWTPSLWSFSKQGTLAIVSPRYANQIDVILATALAMEREQSACLPTLCSTLLHRSAFVLTEILSADDSCCDKNRTEIRVEGLILYSSRLYNLPSSSRVVSLILVSIVLHSDVVL